PAPAMPSRSPKPPRRCRTCARPRARTSGCARSSSSAPGSRAWRATRRCMRQASIAPGPLTDYVPVCLAPQEADAIITQFDMVGLEQVGMLKIDILGLKTLTVIHDAVEMVRARHGVTLAMEALDLADPEV